MDRFRNPGGNAIVIVVGAAYLMRHPDSTRPGPVARRLPTNDRFFGQASKYHYDPASLASLVERRRSCPLLTEILEAGILQILPTHQDAKLATGLKVEKKRLCKKWHIRGTLYVYYEDAAAFTVLLREIGRFRLNRLENSLKNPARLSFSDQRAERFWWKFH